MALTSKDDTTPPQEIVYRIYYSIDEPNSDKDQLNYIGESIGITEFAADDLPPSTRIYLYVLAVDAQSNESNLSAGEAVTTSESDPLSRTDINIFDLDETGFNYEKNGTTIVIKDSGSLSRQSRDGSLVTAQATNSISVNDAVISYNEEEPFVARVKNVSTSSDGIELEVEPISIFDLFSSGKFSFVVAGNANIDITELNYDYETDVGPLNAKVKLDFQPKLEATYEFGSQMRFTGRLFGDWNAEIATRVFGSESASLERGFPIEPLSFEVEYCSGQVNLATI